MSNSSISNRVRISKDTIAAIATPAGVGGIGVIRVSGDRCRHIAEQTIGRVPRTRYAEYVNFMDGSGELLDQGLAIYFKGPQSFTGEDVLELQGHAGPVIMDMILDRVVELGARIARPGEFSERAFLNDKIDLSQAEAIADLIESQSRQAARSAMRSLQGDFSRLISGFSDSLVQLRLFVEASIDFPEEEVDFLSDGDVQRKLSHLVGDLHEIFQQAKKGVVLKEGIRVVLAGRPNAGKSSLMNKLSGRESAIVTEIPGTTRDILTDDIDIDGLRFQLIDTAGLRDSKDLVEAEGVKRAVNEINNADRVLLVVDAEEMPVADAGRITEDISGLDDLLDEKHRITLVLNKIDLLDDVKISSQEQYPFVKVSAKTGEGIDKLICHLKEVTGVEQLPEGNFTARRRHLVALESAMQYLKSAKEQVDGPCLGELLADDLKMAHLALSEITGEFTSDDLLGEIFSSFCIGK